MEHTRRDLQGVRRAFSNRKGVEGTHFLLDNSPAFGLFYSNVRTPNIEFVENIMVKLLAMRYLGGRRLMKCSEVLPLFILRVCLVPDRLL